MHTCIKITLWWGILFSSIYVFSQKHSSQQNRDSLQKIIKSIPISTTKLKAVEFAIQRHLPVRKIYANGKVIEIAEITQLGYPIYYTTHNLNAAKTVGTYKLWPSSGYGYSLEGDEMSVGVWDSGSALFDHVEMIGRVTLMNDVDATDHSTHVAGTIAAAGIRLSAHGMAPKSMIDSYDWSNVLQEMEIAAENGMLVSNHSWGIIQGWHKNSDDDRWEWYGNPSISEEEDYKFGLYGSRSKQWDELSYQFPYFLMVKSAGNDRGQGPSPGETHFIYNGDDWIPSTTDHDKDGGTSGYDCIDMTSTAKNILTVGAVHDITSGYQFPWNVVMSSFSSWGPTDDGRIKPDLVANGIGLYSTLARNTESYGYSNGTSMACPNVSGSLILLQELYSKRYGKFMRAATLKGLAIHTADEAGDFEGPDYRFGWGVLNSFKAAELINESRINQHIFEEILNNEEEYTLSLKANSDESLRVTLSWTDPANEPQSATLDPREAMLINDLDLRVHRLSDNAEFMPYILNRDTPSAAAEYGDNTRDNIEQVFIEFPGDEEYIIEVRHKGQLATPQNISIITSGEKAECLCAKEEAYTEEAGNIMPTIGGLEYAPNSQCEWDIRPDSGKPVYLTFTRFEISDSNDFIEIYDDLPENGNLIEKYSSTNPPTTAISTTGQMFVRFHSDNQVHGVWEATYYTSAPEITSPLAGKLTPCKGSEETYTIKANGAVNYEWNYPSNWNGYFNHDSLYVTVGQTQGVIRVRAVNELGSSGYSEFTVTPTLSTPSSISFVNFDDTPCLGSNTQYEVSIQNNTWYNWIFPDDWEANDSTSSLQVKVGLNGGTIQVTPENNCGTGTPISLDVDISHIPDKPSLISGPDTICENYIETFSVPSKEQISYIWTVPESWEIRNTSNNSLKVKSNIQEGIITASYQNKCGISPFISKSIKIDPLPEQPKIYKEIDGWLAGPTSFEFIWTFNGDTLDKHDNRIYPAYNGTYHLSVANSLGCPVQSEAMIINDPEKELLIFPTYSHGDFALTNDTDYSMSLSITNQTGVQILKLNKLLPGEHSFNITNKGIYSITGTYINDQQVKERRTKRVVVY